MFDFYGFVMDHHYMNYTVNHHHISLLSTLKINLYAFSEVTLKNFLSMGRNLELVEGIINSLVTRLIRQMCSSLSETGMLSLRLIMTKCILLCMLMCETVNECKIVAFCDFYSVASRLHQL